jgi:hypothetical protein
MNPADDPRSRPVKQGPPAPIPGTDEWVFNPNGVMVPSIIYGWITKRDLQD